MLFKLSFRNFKRSARDFTIYFITIVVGIATFYAFDSLSCQRILFDIHTLRVDMWDSIDMLMKFFGVAVTIVLCALILYANNFLLKRRKAEFGTYILLGMSPGKISMLIVFETVLIGIVALVLGLVLGVLLAQVMTFVTASIFDIHMQKYAFLFSIESTFRTIFTFAILFVLVGLFNIVKIRKTKLISLLSRDISGTHIKELPKPLSIFLFLLSIAIILLSYRFLWRSEQLFIDAEFFTATALMVIGTFLLFFSIANFVVAILKNSKRFAYTGVNIFTLRQVTSRMQGAYVTLCAVCIILFFAITIFSTGLGLATIFTGDIKENTLCDATIHIDYRGDGNESRYAPLANDIATELGKKDGDITSAIGQSAQINAWDSGITFGELAKQVGMEYSNDDILGLYASRKMKVMSVDEINAYRKMIGRDPISVEKGKFTVVNSTKYFDELAKRVANMQTKLTIGGEELNANDSVVRLGTSVGAGTSDDGFAFVASNDVIESIKTRGTVPLCSLLNVKYAGNFEKSKADAIFDNLGTKCWIDSDSALKPYSATGDDDVRVDYATLSTFMKTDVEGRSAGIKILFVYLAVYIGFVLLFAVASVLAIQQLCSTLDSVDRYRTLAQIGALRKSLFASLFKQVSIYFLAPLIPALCHFACAYFVLNDKFFSKLMVSEPGPVLAVCVFLLAVYGLYMVISYLGSKNVVKSEVGYKLLS